MNDSCTFLSVTATLHSGAGPLQVEWRNGRLVAIHFGGSRPENHNLPDDFQAFLDSLERYLKGEKVCFRVPIDTGPQPPFMDRVLHECARIPYGVSRSYAELARAAGSPRAARAVGQAMARNPIPIVIPCHRVLASNGHLGGYGGGLDWKRFLLKLEGIPWKEPV